MDKYTVFIVIAVGIVAIIVLYTQRDRLKTFKLKLFGQSLDATTHKPPGPPTAGAHMANVKARDATVRDETGQVATMTGVEAERDATVTAAGPPKEAPDPKKAPPPAQ